MNPILHGFFLGEFTLKKGSCGGVYMRPPVYIVHLVPTQIFH